MRKSGRTVALALAAFAALALMAASAACSGGTSNTSSEDEAPTAPAPRPGTTGEPIEPTRAGQTAEQTAARDGGGQEQGNAGEGRVPLAGGRASFVPPEGFRRLTPGEVSAKYPGANAPEEVFANGSGSVSVAVTLSEEGELRPGQLEEYGSYLGRTLPRVTPGFRGTGRGLEDVGGRRWFHLGFISSAVDADIRNDIYVTSLDARPLQLNFNSTAGRYPEWKDRLEESKDSIDVRD